MIFYANYLLRLIKYSEQVKRRRFKCVHTLSYNIFMLKTLHLFYFYGDLNYIHLLLNQFFLFYKSPSPIVNVQDHLLHKCIDKIYLDVNFQDIEMYLSVFEDFIVCDKIYRFTGYCKKVHIVYYTEKRKSEYNLTLYLYIFISSNTLQIIPLELFDHTYYFKLVRFRHFNTLKIYDPCFQS